MGLEFKPFQYSSEVLEVYFAWFNNEKLRQKLGLYKGTPRSKEDIKAYLLDFTQAPSFEYFHVVKSGQIIGHVGLKNKNKVTSSAEFGFLLGRLKDKEKIFEKALEFIIKLAKKQKLKALCLNSQKASDFGMKIACQKFGFKPDVLKPQFLTLSF